jgi:hypothetical protein
MFKQYLLLQAASAAKHFYADFMHNENGMYYLDFLGGEMKADLDLALSTTWSDIIITTDTCPLYNCNVPHRWNPFDSRTKKEVDTTIRVKDIPVVSKIVETGEFIYDEFNPMMGFIMNDNFEIEYAGNDIEQIVNINFFAITSATNDFKADHNGIVGLRPEGEEDLLDLLIKGGQIEDRIVAVYTGKGEQASFVKFGGYDKECIAEGKELRTTSTLIPSSWDLKSDYFVLLDKNIIGDL